jgi:hypothetical protein
MHSHRRSRGKILFEALCGFGLAASFAGAWDQTGASAFLASASVMALASIYWSFGLFARDRSHQAEQPSAVVVVAPPVEQPTLVVAVAPQIERPSAVASVAPQVEVEAAAREEAHAEAFALQPEVVAEPKPVAKAPKKPRARKAKKAAADTVAVVEQAEPAEFADSAYQGIPLEPLFEPPPFARQPRAFGRKSRVRGPLSAA